MNKWIPFLAVFSLSTLLAQEVTIELKDPVAKNNSIKTCDGGILETNNLRIQANNIDYSQSEDGEKLVTASGDLFIVYRKNYFLADSITFNMDKQKGVLENANGFAEDLYFGGDTVYLNSDGTLDAEKAYFTTSEKPDSEWSISSKKIHMNEKYQVKAENITVNVDRFPVIKGPAFSMGVNSKYKKPESKIKYRVLWEKGQGPLFLTRVKAWDYEGLKLYLRGEYRVTRGGGGAVELDYKSDDKKQALQTRNFYAYDSFYNDNNPNQLKSRYRLQGIYKGKSRNNKLETFARWDVLSDKNMRSDFPTKLFELSTLERTEGFIKSYYDPAYASIYARPRVNTFRGFKQELPTLTVAVKPLSLGNSNIIYENTYRLSYLEYSYANNLNNLVSDFSSGRFETKQTLYRPFKIGQLNIVPKAAVKALYYTNNPQNTPIGQTIAEYDLDAFASLEKSYTNVRHTVEPYAKFSGLTKPTAALGDVYIFSIQDGYSSLNQLKVGLRNDFYSMRTFSPKPLLGTDLYAYNFFDADTLSTPFPKVGLNSTTNLSQMSLNTNFGWNLQKQAVDFANMRLGCTINDFLAFTAEVRHRGKYYWRKNDYQNYLLDVTRSIDNLESTPLSDYRTTFRSKWQFQISPLWTVRLLNHIGWRPNKPFYNETKVELQTYISNTWCLKLNYMRTVRTNQWTMGINLI